MVSLTQNVNPNWQWELSRNLGPDSWFSKSLGQMQDHRGVVTQEDDEEFGSISCNSEGERVQVGVPDSEMCNVLNTPWKGCVWVKSQRVPQGLWESKLGQLCIQKRTVRSLGEFNCTLEQLGNNKWTFITDMTAVFITLSAFGNGLLLAWML